jgi:hypothetical protein
VEKIPVNPVNTMDSIPTGLETMPVGEGVILVACCNRSYVEKSCTKANSNLQSGLSLDPFYFLI